MAVVTTPEFNKLLDAARVTSIGQKYSPGCHFFGKQSIREEIVQDRGCSGEVRPSARVDGQGEPLQPGRPFARGRFVDEVADTAAGCLVPASPFGIRIAARRVGQAFGAFPDRAPAEVFREIAVAAFLAFVEDGL
jgi:hypothetical protein